MAKTHASQVFDKIWFKKIKVKITSFSMRLVYVYTQSCLTLCDPMDCSPPGSSACGILQANILEWIAISSSRGSSPPRDQTHISYISCIDRHVL